MPIYEYQCQACQERTEAIQAISDPPLTTCPECGGDLKKLLSAPAFQFKGEGWYVTDYARKGNGKDGKKEEGGKAASDSGDSKKDAAKTSSTDKPAASPAS